MASKVKRETVREEVTRKIYCGPSLPGLNQFTILNGVPKHLELHMKQCPEIEKLIVEVPKLNEVRLKLLVRGSYEERLYYKVAEYLKGGKR